MKIPKIIHYCWFGETSLPHMLSYCIATWKKQLPDYEIVLWNESNSEFDCEFVRQAYKQKKWAFVSDYIRLKAVYDHGGIYLDTDMLLLKSLDDFLNIDCFLVAEHSQSIGVGIFGASKNNCFIYDCLKYYRNDYSINDKFIPIPKVVTDVFVENYNLPNTFDKNIILDNLKIYTPEYFYALPYKDLHNIHNYAQYIDKTSYGVHLWYGSWQNYNELILIRRKEYYKAIKKIGNTIFIERKFNLNHFKKILKAIKDSLKTKNAFR
jgi:hypothetical protein